MDTPYEWLRSLIEQVPDILHPLIVAIAGAIPYIEAKVQQPSALSRVSTLS